MIAANSSSDSSSADRPGKPGLSVCAGFPYARSRIELEAKSVASFPPGGTPKESTWKRDRLNVVLRTALAPKVPEAPMPTRVPACVVVQRGSVLEPLRASEEFPASPPAVLRCRWPSASARPRAALRAPQRVGALRRVLAQAVAHRGKRDRKGPTARWVWSAQSAVVPTSRVALTSWQSLLLLHHRKIAKPKWFPHRVQI